MVFGFNTAMPSQMAAALQRKICLILIQILFFKNLFPIVEPNVN